MPKDNESKKKILYIMGIDWLWIYQRPQIMAEKLSQHYDVTVIFPRSIINIRYKAIKLSSEFVKKKVLWTIPYQEKIKAVGAAAKLFQQLLFRNYQQYDYIMVGYPLYAKYIPDDYKGQIIYDCMDNHKALYPDRKRVSRIILQEERLIKKSSIVFASSLLLCKKVNRIAQEAKAILIRNGVETGQICEIKKAEIKPVYKIGYIGTIDTWFDFKLLKDSLKLNSVFTYHLIGPFNRLKKKSHSRLIYEGVIEHKYLSGYIRDYDCLLMPFLLNDVVLSVDPLKLYEYISFGKCIISIFYPEIKRFEEFVYFYSTVEEYMELLGQLCKKGFPAKYNKEQQVGFLEDNTWDNRYNKLHQVINDKEAERVHAV